MAHGGVKVEQNHIQFTYRDGKNTITEEHSIYEVKHKTISLLDSINRLIISFIKYLTESPIVIGDVYNTCSSAARVYTLKRLSSKDKILVTLQTDQTLTSFIRFPDDKLESFIVGKLDEGIVEKYILKSEDYAFYPIKKETRNKYDGLFRYYTELETEEFIIKEIEDISLLEMKRFHAIIYNSLK